ncbi:MAG TPA: MFS transporter [Streptosporangiaceae bacterium]|nr:MFS transporter [Streptosporangiaceae bacterium]
MSRNPSDDRQQTIDPTQGVELPVVWRAVLASSLGNAMEWYDYGVFTSGAITATIGAQFFPGSGNAVIKSFTLLALSFIVRPFGGAILGPIGDRIGRQRVLALTVLLMSGGTFLVGVLPTFAGPYSLGYGSTALVMLLRLVQGFSTGGEYGGAATFMAEYAPAQRRGFFGSFLEFGTLTGYVFGNIVVLAVTLGIGPSTPFFAQWGWRIPFLIALPLGLIGLYLRLRMEDTPTFRQFERTGQVAAKPPLLETLTRHWRAIVRLVGIVLLLNVADYTVLTTMPTYFTTQLHYSSTTSTIIIIAVELLMMAVITPMGALSDRIGRKPLLIAMAVGYIVLSYPAYMLMQTHNLAFLMIGFIIVALLLVLVLAVIGSTFPAMFPTRVRYGAMAIGYNVSTSIFGGTAGLLVETLIKITGTNYIPAYYLILAGLIGLVPIVLTPETAKVPMNVIGTARARPAPAAPAAQPD